MAAPSLLVFGPQTTWPSSEYLAQTRENLLSEPRLQSFRSSIKQLPKLWQELVQYDPRLDSTSGAEMVQYLQQWINQGTMDVPGGVPPNVLSMPFTIVIHLVQYFHYLENNLQGFEHLEVLNAAQAGGVQGFCTGLLTAIAVAGAKNEEEISVLGAVALRLAMCVGAYVDLDSFDCDTSVLAVRWTTANNHNRVVDILKDFRNAYISAIRDTTDVNITTPKTAVSSLSQYLTAQNISVKSTGLEGRVHSATNRDALQQILRFCSFKQDLRFSAIDSLLAPVRSNEDATFIGGTPLHEVVLRCMLVDLANWHLTMVTSVAQLVRTSQPSAVTFGLVDCIPSSVLKESGLKVIKWKNANLSSSRSDIGSDVVLSSGAITPDIIKSMDNSYPENSVALIGMGCRFPGADSLEEFWEVISNGTSLCQEMPAERFSTKGLRRSEDGKLKFFGNFIRDADAFDHKFFKKSAREAASMDPQQRILLEVAYAAMEDAGYFGNFKDVPNDIGVYLGACSSDYNDNVASHNPTAFSSLGTLRAFLSGRISHWFNWTGPSITYDTACSSSAVAIDAACKAIQLGECSQAVAGGVSLYTSPNFYQNLAAASFLSKTGPTKPFDAKGDGYCRGEGIGLVVLKKLSAAIADGDNVIGVVAGSAVNQNLNSTYITVPHGGSQQELYRKVARQAQLNPDDVSYVEAHGTGTPVGDPIEMESIVKVFGDSKRSSGLTVASVKGNIGHLEGAAGVASLIKVGLMLQKKSIPIQANYSTLNPKIAAMNAKMVSVPTKTMPWDAAVKIACVNNYGAAGSNAAMIIREGPTQTGQLLNQPTTLPKYPIFLSADSEAALAAYSKTLLAQIKTSQSSLSQDSLTSSIAFNLCNKQNRSLPFTFATTVSDVNQLTATLSGVSATKVDSANRKPLVLCFGGQVSDFIGLDRDVYGSSQILRTHLDTCDAILRASGKPGLYPAIFQTSTVQDVVQLHGMLFSIQYAAAKAWIDSGAQVSAMVGHSFGQLTALCVSGCLSLNDGLKLVCGRASLMQTHWGPERGSMISVQADINTVLDVTSAVKAYGRSYTAEIACYNGPNSHVLVGSSTTMDAAEDVSTQKGIKFRRLQVTHGFHSQFTESLLPGLTDLAETLIFTSPKTHLETCSDESSWECPNPQLIAEHTRTAVYFGQAIERISKRFGSCTWLEAGSASSITGMVRGALSKESATKDAFLSVSLRAGALSALADTVTTLWRAGYPIQFWPFHRCQRSNYTNINLPPYQFERAKHWLQWKDMAEEKPSQQVQAPAPMSTEPVLLGFVQYLDKSQRQAEFVVDPRSKEYGFYVKGHAVLAEPLCPAPLYVELVSRAAKLMDPDNGSVRLPSLEDLEIQAPLGLDINRTVTLSIKRSESTKSVFSFEFSSRAQAGSQQKQVHATGKLALEAEGRKMLTDFSHYERLISYQRFTDLTNDDETEAMQGSTIYKVFERVVTYAPYYKGVRRIFSKDRQVAGLVTLPKRESSDFENTMTEPLAVDNFFQVAGLHVNSLNDCAVGEVFVCTKVDSIRSSPAFKSSETKSWVVYSTFSPVGDREIVNDIFVFDKTTKRMVLIALGAHFTRVQIASLARVLSRANKEKQEISQAIQSQTPKKIETPALSADAFKPFAAPEKAVTPKAKKQKKSAKLAPIAPVVTASNVFADVQKVLSKVSDMPQADIKEDSTLDDLGIDSLMIMEVLTEVQSFFKLEIPSEEWQTLGTPKLLADYLAKRGCGGPAIAAPAEPVKQRKARKSRRSSPSRAVPKTSNPGAVFADVQKVLSKVSDMPESDIRDDSTLDDLGIDSLMIMEVLTEVQNFFKLEIPSDEWQTLGTPRLLANYLVSRGCGGSTDSGASAPADSASSSEQTSDSEESGAESDTTMTSAQSLDDDMVMKAQPTPRAQKTEVVLTPTVATTPASDGSALFKDAQQAFESVRYNYDNYAKQTGFHNFWKNVYPSQSRLVLAYVVEAFSKLGCNLSLLDAGEKVPSIQYLPKHQLLVSQLYNILEDGAIVAPDGKDYIRTDKPIDETPSEIIFQNVVRAYPQHANEHRCCKITGSKLAECLIGTADPLELLFSDKDNKEILDEFYQNAPMFQAITKLLGEFLGEATANPSRAGKFHIMELGGGTGGTTKYLMDYLTKRGVDFTYTFTDISGALVRAARKNFAGYKNMDFTCVDVEKAPVERHLGKYHVILSTNCIHATKNLTKSTTTIRKMLRPDGFCSVVENTRNMFWFDLVFGLLEGWWLFEDGRKHVLADQWFWDSSMRAAGFKHVSWTDGVSEESRCLRVVTAFAAEANNSNLKIRRIPNKRRSEPAIQTVQWKQAGDLGLMADIYFPSPEQMTSSKPRPIALMVHGGGHVMFTKKEVNPKQVKLLLDHGFLPVSIEYRFCPEVNILEGPMADVCDALTWARYQLPQLRLNCPGLQLDSEKVAVVGWSTGGHLAMTTAFTSRQKGIKPPEAILAFYCPTDYESEWWQKPIYPLPAVQSPDTPYDLLEGVQDSALVSHYPATNKNFPGMLMSLDDPRWRFVLHMNWKAQTLPVLLNGLPSKNKLAGTGRSEQSCYKLPKPTTEQIVSISPYSQIMRGNYRTPTYLIHGTADDLIPWEHSQRVVDALKARGVESGIEVLDGVEHLFDTFSDKCFDEIQRAYSWLAGQF